MFLQVTILCLVSIAAAQYRPNYETPAYPRPYEPAYEAKPQPYSFGYDIKDDYGATQSRKEEGDEYGYKRGSYGYTDGYGIYRQVNYVADDKGFRAVVRTNEPGTDNQNPADVEVRSEAAPVKYDAPSSYERPAAYAQPSAPSYSRPAPSYSRPAPEYSRPAPAAYAPAPGYQPPQAYQPAAPRTYQPAPQAAYYAPEPPKYQPSPASSYAPY